VAVAIKVQIDPATLLNLEQQGWQIVRKGVIASVPGDAQGNPTIPIKTDAFEWVDVSLYGIGNTDTALQQLQQQIQQRGSNLYAYALHSRVDFDALGIRVYRYRLTLLHSFVELLEWAVAILAIAFAAIVFWQYVTTGQAPALKDLQTLWGSAVTSIGTAASGVASSATGTAIGWAVALGGVAIALGLVAKEVGVKAPRAPVSSIGVRAGPVTTRLGA
jgi:hypothetical protein